MNDADERLRLYQKYGVHKMHNPGPPVPGIQLHLKVTAEAIGQIPWDQIGRELERMLRSKEEFYEYVNEPDTHPVEWSYNVQDFDGGLRPYRPGDILRPKDMYVVATAKFEPS